MDGLVTLFMGLAGYTLWNLTRVPGINLFAESSEPELKGEPGDE